MAEYRDLLYGRIELPDWLDSFTRIPEFTRLRDVRLSNVDSIQFKDFGSASRWSHCLGVAYLATICAAEMRLPLSEQVTLILSGLLHDVATPPFAHTAEYVLHGYEHELETNRLLSSLVSVDSNPDFPVFGSALPRFSEACRQLSKHLHINVRVEDVAECILGHGKLGRLVSGTIDLDNADNVVRGCFLMGLPVRRNLPIELAIWLARQTQIVVDLENSSELAVQEWLEFRGEYYGLFFSANDQELGRQAFLQHLMRKALEHGLPRSALVWNTDSGFLAALEGLETQDRGEYPLKDLVTRYRLLEPLYISVDVEIIEPTQLRVLSEPEAVAWMEHQFQTPESDFFLMVTRNRGGAKRKMLWVEPLGRFLLFRLGGQLEWKHLPEWLQAKIGRRRVKTQLVAVVAEAVSGCLTEWSSSRPWLESKETHATNVVSALTSIGDWSFRVSRNRSLHSYPGTFVHAIPTTLLHALGLHGSRVLDPFGGTGQTAAEVAKVGGTGISADSNAVATMVASAKLTYLSRLERNSFRKISRPDLVAASFDTCPEFPLRDRWHHPKTLDELCQILSYIQQHQSQNSWPFLATCFSAILPSCTARRGKQHGFFADNTPLAKNEEAPPYQDAIHLFLEKIRMNLEILEQYYGFFERGGREAKIELGRTQILRKSVVNSSADTYGIEPASVDAVITSPPYLCMADYSLGNRLSYHWLFPKELEADFKVEVGARRTRSNPKIAETSYFLHMGHFARLCGELIKPGGFLAMVIGEPQAEAFRDIKVMDKIDVLIRDEGLDLFWEVWRPIHWHRNHGYHRLRQERIAVFKKQ